MSISKIRILQLFFALGVFRFSCNQLSHWGAGLCRIVFCGSNSATGAFSCCTLTQPHGTFSHTLTFAIIYSFPSNSLRHAAYEAFCCVTCQIKNYKLVDLSATISTTSFFSCPPHSSLVFLPLPFPSVPLLPQTTLALARTPLRLSRHVLTISRCYLLAVLPHPPPPFKVPLHDTHMDDGSSFIVEGCVVTVPLFPLIVSQCFVSLPTCSREGAADNELFVFQTVFNTLFVSVCATFFLLQSRVLPPRHLTTSSYAPLHP